MDPFANNNFQDEFEKLTPDQQAEVMSFLRALRGTPVGTPGHQLLDLAGTISPEDLKLMEEAIEQGCEQVDLNGW
jgi:hypothetical protein